VKIVQQSCSIFIHNSRDHQWHYQHILQQLPVFHCSPFSSHYMLEWPNTHRHKIRSMGHATRN